MTFQLLVKKKNRGEKESECKSNARGGEMRNGAKVMFEKISIKHK